MTEHSISSGPWASFYAHCNRLAKWHTHRHHMIQRLTEGQRQKLGSSTIPGNPHTSPETVGIILPFIQFSSFQSLSHVKLFATPWIAARQAALSITNSQSSLRLTSIESVMPSSHLILCRPLLLPWRLYLTAGNPRARRVSGLEGWNLKNIPELLDFKKSEVKGGIRVQGTGLRRRREQKQRSRQTEI